MGNWHDRARQKARDTSIESGVITREEARAQVETWMESHELLKSRSISFYLGIHYNLINRVLQAMRDEGIIEVVGIRSRSIVYRRI